MPSHGFCRAGDARFWRAVMLTLVVLLSLAGPLSRVEAAPMLQSGGPGETLFQAKCAACHTIGGGKLVGPDLQDVTARRDAAWLKSFIADPNKLFAAHDPIAQQLLAESNNVKMPALGLTAAEVDALIAFLGRASPAADSAAAPAVQPAAAVGSPAAGQHLFTGESQLGNGGPACIACHSVNGIGALGGGALGPDLTHATQRYPGPGLATVLENIAFPTMVGPFENRPLTPQEAADLAAFMAQADQRGVLIPAAAAGAITAHTWWVLTVGLIGALALTILLAIFWPRQRQSISARLRNAHKPTAD